MFLFIKMLNYTVEPVDKDIFAYNKSIPNQTKKYINDIIKKALPIDLYEAYKEYNYGIFKKWFSTLIYKITKKYKNAI